MDLISLAARIAQEQQEEDSSEHTSRIVKTPGKGYCVKSEKKDSDWSGGCYPSKGEAKKRLKQVEYFKHKGSSVELIMANCNTVLLSDTPPPELLSSFHALLAAQNDEDSDDRTSQQEQEAKAPPGWKKTVEHMKGHPEIDNPFALSWYMKEKGDKPHKKSSVAAGGGVTVKSFEWDPGDKRSYGSFKVVADTPHGELVGEGMIDSGGGTENETWTLGGKPISSDVDYPDLGIPHYYAGARAMSRFEKVKDQEIPEILSEWLAGYIADTAGSQ